MSCYWPGFLPPCVTASNGSCTFLLADVFHLEFCLVSAAQAFLLRFLLYAFDLACSILRGAICACQHAYWYS